MEHTEFAGVRDWKYIAARAVSYVMHPFLMPVYGVLLLLFGNTFVAVFPERLKLYIVEIVAINVMAIPAFSVLMLRRSNLIPNISLDSQAERTLPLIVVALCYLFCFYLLSFRLPVPFMGRIMFGAFLVVLSCFIINFFWKISLHMAATGGVVGILLSMNIFGYGYMPAILMVSIIGAGFLGTARLYLGKHNIWQVLAGFLMGAAITYITLYF